MLRGHENYNIYYGFVDKHKNLIVLLRAKSIFSIEKFHPKMCGKNILLRTQGNVRKQKQNHKNE